MRDTFPGFKYIRHLSQRSFTDQTIFDNDMTQDFSHRSDVHAVRSVPLRQASVAWLLMTHCVLMNDAVAVPGDVSLQGKHSLSQVQAGEVLINELRCAACHRGAPTGNLPERTAPDLTQAGSRISHDFLKRFLESPASAHPGTAMPDVLGTRPENERRDIAEALAHFLVAQAESARKPSPPAISSTEPAEASHGKTLFHSVGCVACHGAKDLAAEGGESASTKPGENNTEDEDEDEANDEAAPGRSFAAVAVPIGHAAAKYSTQSLHQFLFQCSVCIVCHNCSCHEVDVLLSS